MISFKIYKGEKDESEIVFIRMGEQEPKKLVFEVIKDYAYMFLKETADGKDNTYDIEVADPSLESYKQIVGLVFDSVIKDNELLDLYKEASNNQDEEKQQ